MEKITIDNRLGEYPYWLCSPNDLYEKGDILQFTYEECDIPIDNIGIDKKGVHYYVAENCEVNNKGFYFFTEQDVADFLDKNCKNFNDMKIRYMDKIYSEHKVYNITGAYYDEDCNDIRIETNDRNFFFSELGKSFTLAPQKTERKEKPVYAVTHSVLQYGNIQNSSTLGIYESKKDAQAELLRIKETKYKIISENEDGSFVCAEKDKSPQSMYSIKKLSIILKEK